MVALNRCVKLLTAPAALAISLLITGCVCGPGPNVGGYDDGGGEDPPKSLQGIKFVESEKGDPNVIGCSDGQREGFGDLTKHRRIAGCLASWEGSKSLRDKTTNKPCGDDGGVCEVPADACAENWHVCGHEGKNRDLKTHTTWRACAEEAGPGKFVAAMSHGQTDELCPPPPKPSTIFPCMDSGLCSEPICCGEDCQLGKCKDAVWRGKTYISLGKAEGCGAITSERNGGVLCCYDGKGAPKPTTPPPPAAGDPAAAPTGGTPEAAAPTAGTPAPAAGTPAPGATAKPSTATPPSTKAPATTPPKGPGGLPTPK
ncbi:MAG: hypothetical protein ACPG4T_19465 [Nannocystaceae bacterium]